MHYEDIAVLKEYGEHFGLIVYYAPDNIRKDILLLEKALFSNADNDIDKEKLLTSIAVNLRKFQQSR